MSLVAWLAAAVLTGGTQLPPCPVDSCLVVGGIEYKDMCGGGFVLRCPEDRYWNLAFKSCVTHAVLESGSTVRTRNDWYLLVQPVRPNPKFYWAPLPGRRGARYDLGDPEERSLTGFIADVARRQLVDVAPEVVESLLELPDLSWRSAAGKAGLDERTILCIRVLRRVADFNAEYDAR